MLYRKIVAGFYLPSIIRKHLELRKLCGLGLFGFMMLIGNVSTIGKSYYILCMQDCAGQKIKILLRKSVLKG